MGSNSKRSAGSRAPLPNPLRSHPPDPQPPPVAVSFASYWDENRDLREAWIDQRGKRHTECRHTGRRLCKCQDCKQYARQQSGDKGALQETHPGESSADDREEYGAPLPNWKYERPGGFIQPRNRDAQGESVSDRSRSASPEQLRQSPSARSGSNLSFNVYDSSDRGYEGDRSNVEPRGKKGKGKMSSRQEVGGDEHRRRPVSPPTPRQPRAPGAESTLSWPSDEE